MVLDVLCYYVFDWVSPTRSSNVRGWAEIIVCLGRIFYLHKHVKGRPVKCAVWRGEGSCKFVTHGWFDALYSFNLQFGLGKPPLYWFTRNKHSPHRQMFRHRQVHKQMFDGNTNTIKLSQLSDKHPPYWLMLTNRSGFKYHLDMYKPPHTLLLRNIRNLWTDCSENLAHSFH